MEASQVSKSSEASKSQSEYKKVSETKSLKKLKSFLNSPDIIGVDTAMAGITLTPDVMEFCQKQGHLLIGRVIYFYSGVMSE